MQHRLDGVSFGVEMAEQRRPYVPPAEKFDRELGIDPSPDEPFSRPLVYVPLRGRVVSEQRFERFQSGGRRHGGHPFRISGSPHRLHGDVPGYRHEFRPAERPSFRRLADCRYGWGFDFPTEERLEFVTQGSIRKPERVEIVQPGGVLRQLEPHLPFRLVVHVDRAPPLYRILREPVEDGTRDYVLSHFMPVTLPKRTGSERRQLQYLSDYQHGETKRPETQEPVRVRDDRVSRDGGERQCDGKC